MPLRLSDMFQSKFVDGEDLARLFPAGCVVTIEGVRPFEMTARQGAPGQEDGAEAKVEWALKVREIKKPIRLKRHCADAIAKALGIDDVEQWFGGVVRIHGVQLMAYGQLRWFVNADEIPPESGPSLPLNSDLKLLLQSKLAGRLPGRTAAPNTMDLVPIGAESAERMKAALAEKGKTWDGFLVWLKKGYPGALQHAFGVELADLPRYLIRMVKEYLADLPPPEAVDRSTGEVMNPAPAPRPAPAAPVRLGNFTRPPPQEWGAPAPPMGEDDIPF